MLAAPALAQLAYNEPPDLSNTLGVPTPVGTLAAGVNTVTGMVVATWSAVGPPIGDGADSFSFTVPPGLAVTSVDLVVVNFGCNNCFTQSSSFSGLGFLVVNQDGIFPVPITAPGGFLPAGIYNAYIFTDQYVPNAAGSGTFTYQYRIRVVPDDNDSCEFATPIGLGVTAFNNTAATTDGPDHPALCNFFDNPGIGKDLWYAFTPAMDGILTVNACNSTYETELALYQGAACGNLLASILACNDDNPECGGVGTRSLLRHVVAAGQTYLIRVGGFGTDAGSGELNLSIDSTGACCIRATGGCLVLTAADCATLGGEIVSFTDPCSPANCTACPADFNRSGVVSVQDIFDFLAAYFAGCP